MTTKTNILDRLSRLNLFIGAAMTAVTADDYAAADALINDARRDIAAIEDLIQIGDQSDSENGCRWVFEYELDYGAWKTHCGKLWSFNEGGPADNGVTYCHGCGEPVVVVIPVKSEEAAA